MTAKPFDTPGGCGLFDTIPPELRSAIYDELPNEAWVRHPDIYVHASGEQEVDPRRGPSYFGSGSELISTNKALGREVVRTRGEHFKNHMLKLTIDVSSTRANGWSAVENIASIIPESAERLVLLLKWKYTWWRGWRAPTKALDQIFDLSNLPKLRKLVVLSDTTEMDTLHILRIAFLRDISHDHCGCPCALPARLLYQLEIKVVLSAKFSEYSILRRRQALPFVRSAYQKRQENGEFFYDFALWVVGYGRGSPLPRAVYFPFRIAFLQQGQSDAATNYVFNDLPQAKYAKWAAFLEEMAMEKILQEAQDWLDMEEWRNKYWGRAIVQDTWRGLKMLFGFETIKSVSKD